jgi:hypothetical protein
MAPIGLTGIELPAEIGQQLFQLDQAHEEAKHLGPYGDLLRLMAATAFQRAADLILLNNERITAQLAEAGVVWPSRPTAREHEPG